nr:MAG TPA: Putative antitoxin of bacterial toxin-antitoxin system, YdaS/YdaT [Caudoviricetes sp.]
MISFNRRTCGLSVWCVFFLIYQDSKLKVYRLNIHNVDLNINIMFNLVRYYLEPNMKALDKAICIVGGATRLAEKLNVSPMTVSHWRHRDNGFVPANRVIPIFNATGVTPHELRPDLYLNPTDGLPAQEARA